jgi:hypothetical protein
MVGPIEKDKEPERMRKPSISSIFQKADQLELKHTAVKLAFLIFYEHTDIE